MGQDVSRYQCRRSKNSVKEYNVKPETNGCTDRRLCDLMSFVIRESYLKRGLHETQTKTQKNSHYLVRGAHKSADRHGG